MNIGRDRAISFSVCVSPPPPHGSKRQRANEPERPIDDLHHLVQQPVHDTVRCQRRRNSVRASHRRQQLVHEREEIARCGHDGGKHLRVRVWVGGNKIRRRRNKNQESRIRNQEIESRMQNHDQKSGIQNPESIIRRRRARRGQPNTKSTHKYLGG